MSQHNAESLQEVSMKIILGAGDARADIQAALKDVETFKFEEAEAKLAKAKKAYVSSTFSSNRNDSRRG